MKILAIIGSPRKNGNSYKITKQVEEKMKQLDNEVKFEYLFLTDANLEQCKGCLICILKGEHFCPIKDDRAKIRQQMLGADGVIFVSPVYVMNVTSLMKNFIDRFAYVCHRPCFFKQYAMLISTAAGIGLKETLNCLSAFPDATGFNIVHKLGVITSVVPQTEDKKNKIKNKTDNAAIKFYKSIKTKKQIAPKLGNLIQFKVFKILSSSLKDILLADYEYYKDKKNYFFATKINILKKLVAWFIGKMIKSSLNKKSR